MSPGTPSQPSLRLGGHLLHRQNQQCRVTRGNQLDVSLISERAGVLCLPERSEAGLLGSSGTVPMVRFEANPKVCE